MTSPTQIQEFTGATAIYPAAGKTFEVLTGELLVFAELADGRRLPITTLRSGAIMAGCAITDSRTRLLVTAQQGTSLRESTIAEMLDAQELDAPVPQPDATSDTDQPRAIRPFDHWIYALSQAALNGGWATKVVAPEGLGSLRLAPGEAVVPIAVPVPPSNHSVLGWLKVTSGSAAMCGWRDAQVGVLDAPVPITRGVWLTSGLRCQIGHAPEPVDSQGWSQSLDLMARLTLEAVRAIDADQNLSSIERRVVAQELAQAETLQGIDLLAGAVVGPIARPRVLRDTSSAALAAAFATVESSGLAIDETDRDRAQAQVFTGRDPFTAAGAACGARARAIDLAPLWFTQDGPPLVAATREGHFVSLTWQGRSWSVTDPQLPGVQQPLSQEWRERLTGRAWEFVPILPSTSLGLSSLFRLGFRRSGRDLSLIAILTAGLAALAFFTPFILGKVAGAVTNTDIRSVLAALLTLFILLLVSVSWQYVRSVALLRIRVRGTALTSGAVWDRIMRLRTTWHDKYSMGERMTQSSAVGMASTAVPDAIIVGLLDTVAILGGLAAIATTSTPLLIAAILLLSIQLLVNLWLTRESARRTLARVTAQSAAQGRLLETLQAVNRLRVSGAESRAFKRWAVLQAKLTRADLSVRQIAMVQVVIISAWPVLGLMVIVAVTGATGATFGDFVTAQAAVAIATTTLAVTAFSASALFNGRAVISKVEPVLAAIPEGGNDGVDPGRISGGVTFNDIVFRYESGSRPVLDGVSFSISPGEQVAIVGPSGCGKTTLMRILLGLEEPESGVVTVDGQDLAVLDLPSFRRQVGSVLQSSTLLPGPIRDNVDMGRGLTSTEIWQALEWACVADEVRAMGMGLDTPVVDGGGTVSGGQRQRILLARALASNPRMLILDEATSALDNLTQGSIVEHLENLRLTRILIAHRLTTIQGADRIIVIAGGRVAQQGTFEELVSQPGHFADLVQRQVV